MQAWCLITVESSGRHQRMASPRFKSPYWLLPAAALVAALVAGSAASFAQVTSDETVIMNTIDHAVRTREFDRAATVLRKFAESGNSEAQYRLASLYRIGRGVSQDDLLAFKWMKAAAEQNHANAQFNLARMYLAGRGAAPDVGSAKVWLRKAAAQQYDEATKLLVEISARRTVEANANEAPPRPTRIETSLQRGLATAPRNAAAEILDAAWRGQHASIGSRGGECGESLGRAAASACGGRRPCRYRRRFASQRSRLSRQDAPRRHRVDTRHAPLSSTGCGTLS